MTNTSCAALLASSRPHPPIPHAQLHAQMQDERNQALDRVNLLDMELTAVRSAVNDVQGALQREQQRSVELADAVAAKDKVGFGGW